MCDHICIVPELLLLRQLFGVIKRDPGRTQGIAKGFNWVYYPSVMPITSSAKKAHRAGEKKRIFNIRRSSVLRAQVKNIQKLVRLGKIKEANSELPKAYKAIDKAAKRGIIKENTASRKKARLSASIKRAE